MRFTFLGHSAIAVSAPEGTIIVDPGALTDLSCLQDADAVLLTHAHGDHVAVDAVAATSLPVWGAVEALDALATAGHTGARTELNPGDTATILGQEVRVIGGLHEVIHPEVPRPENLAFYMDGLLHPGDEYAESPWPVDVLLLPVAGPWVKAEHAANYARRVAPHNTVPVHDAVLSPAGKQLIDGLLGTKLALPGYRRLAVGETLEF